MPPDDYEERTKDDLLQEARDRGLSVSSSANKPEVVNALQEDDKAKLGAAGASDDEPEASVKYVGPTGLVCDPLLPYQQERGDLVNGTEYSAPVSVVRQLVLNGNFEPSGQAAEDLLAREERRSNAGRLRAQRLLAGNAATGETAEMFDQRSGIARVDADRVIRESFAVERYGAEKPEFDPMAEFEGEEA